MKKIINILILLVAVFGVAFYSVNSYTKSSLSSSSTSKNESLTGVEDSNNSLPTVRKEPIKIKAKNFTLKDLDGKEVSLSDFKGKRVFLNFWTTWCPSCKLEMPDIQKLYQETKSSDLVILSIDIGEDANTVKKFITENNYKFKFLLDKSQDVAVNYNITSIPTSFFIDKDGNIISKKIGAMTLQEMKAYINTTK